MAACPRAQRPPWLIGCMGPPSSFLAARMRTTPAWPFGTTSASASITRTVRPHPAAHSGQTPGFHAATPGMMSSAGTNRTRGAAGLPQPERAALVPVTAVSLMKERRSIGGDVSLEMAGQAVGRDLPFVVTVHAVPHRQLDVPLGDGLLADIAVTRRALDLRADVRRVIELDVGGRRVAVHALPRQIDALGAHRRDLFDPWSIDGDRVVADHAGPDARKTRDGTCRDAFMAVLGARDLFRDVHVVWKLDRLNRSGCPAQEVVDRRAHRGARRGEDPGGLPRQQGPRWRGGARGLEHPPPRPRPRKSERGTHG